MFKFYFLDDDMILNTTQVFIAIPIPIPCIMIICPFSSSHFATQIFPIDELLKPYTYLIENYVLNPTFICKLTIFVVFLSFILYKTIQGISRVIMSLTE
jgi:hypothetical protein